MFVLGIFLLSPNGGMVVRPDTHPHKSRSQKIRNQSSKFKMCDFFVSLFQMLIILYEQFIYLRMG